MKDYTNKEKKNKRELIMHIAILLPIIMAYATTNVYASESIVSFDGLFTMIFGITKAIGILAGIFGVIMLGKAFASDQPEAKLTGGTILAVAILIYNTQNVLQVIGLV
ncbi:hypothetical protein [Clostridium cochlearium]|uniref:hypothetical protein n=1 Tax=Clostridium cochlearium TaxID=1494 RepID=UPI00241DE9E8|nr:hypothetical protein [Clostridium cochlearium]MBE6065916.1 hypothetical protein [Clostridium cochlearium]